jgi:primosomal protein N' (replication factor Y)
MTGILHKGIGTKKIEDEIRRLFPDAIVRRFDGDTARGEAVQDVFNELESGKTDIIIGTQTVAKGLDLPNLRLVGIVQADAGLALPDFSATERTLQLIAQATGRVGRGAEDSQVIVQTYQPNALAVQFGVAQNYAGFYEHEIKNRQLGHFPPFAHLLKLTCAYKTEKGAINAAKKLAAVITSKVNNSTKILGPAPAFYERVRNLYRWQIVVRSTSRDELLKIAKEVPPAHWQAELDPNSLI